jgi:DNA-binding NarL/FixJ family response regulator
MSRPRVLLADDHRLLREAFAALLRPGCEVVGTAADGRELLAAADALKPDVVVLDIAMPRLNGLDAGRQLKRRTPAVKLIFLTVSEDPDLAAEAFRAGASGYLLKSSAAAELIQAVAEVSRGQVYVTPLAAQATANSAPHAPGPRKAGGLSPRQREVLQLLAEGHSMKEVARILKVTPRTVAFHKYSMMEELGIRTNAELIQYAIKQHLVSV